MKRDLKTEERAIIEALYAPLSGEGTLLNALQAIQRYMDTDRAVLGVGDVLKGRLHISHETQPADASYEREFRRNAPFFIKEERNLLTRFAKEGIAQYGAIRSFDHTPIGGFFQRHRVGNSISGYIFRWNGLQGRIGLYRHGKRRLHTAEELRRLTTLFPHIQASFQATVRLEAALNETENTQSALDRISVGMALLDADLQVTFLNRRGDELVSQGTMLHLEGRRLYARNPEEDERLQTLFRGAALTGRGAGTFPGGSLTIHSLQPEESSLALKGNRRVLHLSATPIVFPPRSPSENARGLIPCISDAEARRPRVLVAFQENRKELPACSAEILRSLYGLTSTEASLVIALAGGRTPEEYATFFGLSPHTIRQHLKSIFKKMGVCRQTDLVRIVLSGPAGWMI